MTRQNPNDLFFKGTLKSTDEFLQLGGPTLKVKMTVAMTITILNNQDVIETRSVTVKISGSPTRSSLSAARNLLSRDSGGHV